MNGSAYYTIRPLSSKLTREVKEQGEVSGKHRSIAVCYAESSKRVPGMRRDELAASITVFHGIYIHIPQFRLSRAQTAGSERARPFVRVCSAADRRKKVDSGIFALTVVSCAYNIHVYIDVCAYIAYTYGRGAINTRAQQSARYP